MRGLPNVTYYILIHQSLRNWERHDKQHAFLYQFWITEILLNILLGLQTTTSKIPLMRLMSLDHESKNKMMCYEFESWDLTLFCVNMGSFGLLKRFFQKSMIVLTWCRSPIKWNHVMWKNLSSTVFSYATTGLDILD